MPAAGAAAFSTVFEHAGSNDPVIEGWAMHPGYRPMGFGPLAPDGGFAENAWFVDDNSTLGGSTLTYDGALTAAQVTQAAESGWRLSARLRVVDVADGVDASVFVGYNSGTIRYSMVFGSDAAGNPIARLWDGTSIGGLVLNGPSVNVSGNGYHLYELIYDPVAGSASLFVDGAETISGYTGFVEASTRSVMWGGGHSIATGQANYNLVNWGIAEQTVPENTPPVVTVGGFAFDAPFTLSTGSRSQGVTSGDFNNDGFDDLANTNYDSNSFSVHLGDGSGGFTSLPPVPTPSGPNYVASGDFNKDGNADLAVSTYAGNSVVVYLGNGDGSFVPGQPVYISTNPLFAVPLDFNNDGYLDLIAGANNGGWRLYALRGNGNGTFTTVSGFGGGYSQRNPRDPAIADFNGDGYADLLVPNAVSGTVHLFANNGGSGGFTDLGVVTSGTRFEGAATADFNGDGFADAAVSMAPLNRVRVMLGDGAGHFSIAGDYGTGQWPNIMRSADMNGDGVNDIVVATYTSAGVSILLGNGDGTFQPDSHFATAAGAGSVALANINGDGRPDIATAYAGGTGVGGAAVLLSGSAEITVEATDTLTPVTIGPATAFDLEDGVLTPVAENEGPFPLGTTTVTWSATDSLGSTGTATQNVTVVDTTAPEFTAPPPDVTVEAGGDTSPAATGMATATDIFLDAVTYEDTVIPGDITTGVVSVISRLWSATDTNGHATTATQTITVVDTTPPIISLNGESPVTIEAGSSYVDAGASAFDMVDGDLTVSIITSGNVTSIPGSYTVNYDVSDAAGNAAQTVSRTVIVVDTTPPVLTIPADVTAEANAVLSTVDIGTVSAEDLVDGTVAVTSDAPATFQLGLTVVTYTATDAAGNTVTAAQNVTVVDTTPPVLSVPADVSAEANGVLSTVDIGMATATDIFEVTISSDALASYPLGSTLVTWTATDASGNTATGTQSVTVSDTTAPVLSVPADVTAEATGVLTEVAIETATATDIFEVTISSDAPANYPLGTTLVTWTAVDANGNTSTGTQSVTVVDTTAPVLSVPADVSAEATGLLTQVDIGMATADDIFAVNIANDAPANYPLGTTLVTWTATDANGNVSSATQNVTVADSTAPTVTAQLVPLKLKKHEGTFRVEFSATDLVDPDPAISATLNGVTVTDGQVIELKAGKKVKIKIGHGEIEITAPSFTLDVTATDASGNTGTGSAAYAFPAPKDEHEDNGIHRGNDKDDHHADSGKHKSEGKARIEHKDNGKSKVKADDRKSDSKKDKKRS